MEVLEGQNILVTISGKKCRVRVYYLSWLKSKILRTDGVSNNFYFTVNICFLTLHLDNSLLYCMLSPRFLSNNMNISFVKVFCLFILYLANFVWDSIANFSPVGNMDMLPLRICFNKPLNIVSGKQIFNQYTQFCQKMDISCIVILSYNVLMQIKISFMYDKRKLKNIRNLFSYQSKFVLLSKNMAVSNAYVILMVATHDQ